MKVGYCYVVGDLLHKGHLLHLKNCKALCDVLICGVLSDSACCEKKPAPAITFDERIDLIGSIKYVDIAVCQNEYSPLNNCKSIRPDLLFESSSHDEMPANNFMKSVGGKVIVMPYYAGQSSTQIKERIKEDDKNDSIDARTCFPKQLRGDGTGEKNDNDAG